MICEKCAHKLVCGFIDGYSDDDIEECEYFAFPQRFKISDEEKREKKREKDKRLYHERKEKGLCVSCGKPTVDGKSKCEKCIVYDREYHQNRKNRFREQGLCPCGKPRYKDYKLCYECLIKSRRYAHEHRKPSFRELGLCMNCGKKEPINGHPYCAECYEWKKQICLKTLFNEDGTHKYPMKDDHPWRISYASNKK